MKTLFWDHRDSVDLFFIYYTTTRNINFYVGGEYNFLRISWMNTTLILFRPSLSSLHLSPCCYSIPSQIHNLFFCNILLHIDFEWKTNPPWKLQGTKICQSLSPSSFPEDKVTFLTAVAIYLQIKVRKKGLFSPDSLRVQPTLVERYYSKNMSQLVLLWSVRKKWQEPSLPKQFQQLVTKYSNARPYQDITHPTPSRHTSVPWKDRILRRDIDVFTGKKQNHTDDELMVKQAQGIQQVGRATETPP